MKIVNLVQGTSEWLAWRQAGLGSSDMPVILGVSPWTKPEALLKEKITGKPARRSNSAMRRGHDLEPVARSMYEGLMGFAVKPICAEDDEFSWLRVSLDGWNPELLTSIEIKAPNKYDHADALAGKVPEKYRPQCDQQMRVSGALVHHYVSYNPSSFTKSESFTIVSYQRNEEAIKNLIEKARQFWEQVLAGRALLEA